MNICIPIEVDNGLDSRVFGHFGSAPFFLIADADSETHEVITNTGAHHAHGMCQPLAMLAGQDISAVVVGGIGRGALLKLQGGGIEVFLAREETARETIKAYKEGNLNPVTLEHVCGGHAHHPSGGGCSH